MLTELERCHAAEGIAAGRGLALGAPRACQRPTCVAKLIPRIKRISQKEGFRSREQLLCTSGAASNHSCIHPSITLRVALIHMLEHRRTLLVVQLGRVGAWESGVEGVFDGQLQL